MADEPKVTLEVSTSSDPKEIANDLASILGRERGAVVLKEARRVLLEANGGKLGSGSSTSEFKLAVLATAAGFLLVVTGGFMDDPDLRDQGLELVKWSVGAYAISRGFAKQSSLAPPK